MKTNSTARRIALAMAGAAVTAAVLVPAAAQAQQYGPNGQYYDACARDQSGRSVVGAIVGGLAGMALGNNIVDDRSYRGRGRYSDNDTGATVGALLGAGVGASVGRNSAACSPDPRYRQQQQTYRNNYNYTPEYYAPAPRYDDYYSYQQTPSYAPPPPAYDDRYYDDRSYNQQGACRMVESRIRMPDGRTQTRMVQACPDSQGRYQIVG